MTTPTAQIPGVYHRRFGDIVVTAISDGYLDGVYEFMRDITPQDAESILKESYRPAPPRISVNTFVIHSAGRMALVDTGSQNSMGPTLGHMPKHLAAAGIDPKKIDTILLTHMHPDHSNGLTDANGKAIYPHVELVVAERDVNHWHDDAAMARATERQKMRFFQWAREQIAPKLVGAELMSGGQRWCKGRREIALDRIDGPHERTDQRRDGDQREQPGAEHEVG